MIFLKKQIYLSWVLFNLNDNLQSKTILKSFEGENYGNAFATIWETISDYIPDDPALICDENVITWKEYEDRAARLASFLNEKSIGNTS